MLLVIRSDMGSRSRDGNNNPMGNHGSGQFGTYRSRKMKKELTSAEERTYDAIVDFIMEHGYPPTCRELCDMVGIKSTSTIHKRLMCIHNKGWITVQGAPRAINVAGYKFIKED